MSNSKRAIIVEFNTYHGEVLPSLVYFLNQQGYDVDIYASKKVTELDPFVMTSSLKFSIHTISDTIELNGWKKLIEGYDLLVWNSVEPERHLAIIEQIEAPTLAIIHNGNRILTQEYQDYFSKPYRQALVLSTNLQKYFDQESVDVNWVFPSFFSDAPVNLVVDEDCFSFCVQGKVEFKRRNYFSMISAIRKLNQSSNVQNFDVRLLGKSDSLEGFALRQLVRFGGVSKLFCFSSKVSMYQEYYSELARSDFLCPLIDETKEAYKSYFTDKASSSIPTALGNGLVPIVQRRFASLYGVEKFSICYDDGELLGALKEALNLSADELLAKKQRVLEANKSLLEGSVQNLAAAIQKIELNS